MRSIFGGARAKPLARIDPATAPLGGLHLLADGMRIEPAVNGLSARFYVPSRYRKLDLKSRTARPCDVLESGDTRELGVCISGLTLIDKSGAHERIPIDDPRLGAGLYGVQDGWCRWTIGTVPLADIAAGRGGDFFLQVELASRPFC